MSRDYDHVHVPQDKSGGNFANISIFNEISTTVVKYGSQDGFDLKNFAHGLDFHFLESDLDVYCSMFLGWMQIRNKWHSNEYTWWS